MHINGKNTLSITFISELNPTILSQFLDFSLDFFLGLLIDHYLCSVLSLPFAVLFCRISILSDIFPFPLPDLVLYSAHTGPDTLCLLSVSCVAISSLLLIGAISE